MTMSCFYLQKTHLAFVLRVSYNIIRHPGKQINISNTFGLNYVFQEAFRRPYLHYLSVPQKY